jgi:hypothetical protein
LTTIWDKFEITNINANVYDYGPFIKGDLNQPIQSLNPENTSEYIVFNYGYVYQTLEQTVLAEADITAVT